MYNIYPILFSEVVTCCRDGAALSLFTFFVHESPVRWLYLRLSMSIVFQLHKHFAMYNLHNLFDQKQMFAGRKNYK